MNLTKPKYQWASIRSQTLKRLALILLATFLALISWAGLRYWEYQQEAPLRAGISAFKGGDYPTALFQIY